MNTMKRLAKWSKKQKKRRKKLHRNNSVLKGGDVTAVDFSKFAADSLREQMSKSALPGAITLIAPSILYNLL